MVAIRLGEDLESCLLEVEQASRGISASLGGRLLRSHSSDGVSGGTGSGPSHQKDGRYLRSASREVGLLDESGFTEDLGQQDGERRLGSPQEFWTFKQKELEALNRSLEAEEDAEMLQGADQDLTGSVERLGNYVNICNSIIDNIAHAKGLLDDLETKHRTVSEKTSSLHETCKKLLEEQVRFEKIVNDIELPLSYLKEVDRIGPLLGLPLETRLKTVLPASERGDPHRRALNPDSPQFFDVLVRLDECIEYIEAHPEFKDYEEYSKKFHQLHLRGLSLIRNVISDSLHATTNSARIGIESKLEALRKNVEGQNPSNDIEARLVEFDSDVNTLMFIRYRALSKQLRSYINELEHRVGQKDANDLLYGVHKTYCTLRLELLQTTVPRRKELSQKNDLLTTLRIACPYLLNVAKGEFKLFHEFFSHESCERLRLGDEFDDDDASDILIPSDARSTMSRKNSNNSMSDVYTTIAANVPKKEAFKDMMTGLCGLLYDLVRPLIVKLNDLELLCEAVRVIEGELIEGYIDGTGEAGAALHDIVVQVLLDIQERLIYSASEYISDNILNFEPSQNDLDYPNILTKLMETNESSRRAMYSGCYKTLENTLMCLGMIYRCVSTLTFEELAQDAVSSCSTSLVHAADLIGRTSRMDGDLFFIKHLLVLREQISPFNTQLTVKHLDLDFHPTALAFNRFLSRSRYIFSRHNNAIVDLVAHGVPSIRESELDCKRDLETQLKHACEQFIIRAYEQALATLLAFLQRASKPIEDESKAFQDQDFAQPDKVQTMLQHCLTATPEFLQIVRSKMSLYLANQQTESILYKPIKANIFSALTQLTNCIEANYTQDQAGPMLKLVSSLRGSINQLEEQV